MLDQRMANAALATLVRVKVRETLNPLLKSVGGFVSETTKNVGWGEISTLEELEMKVWLLQLVREMADSIIGEQEKKAEKAIQQLAEKNKPE